MLAVSGLRAADTPEPGRFLLVFETSPALKKNLPAVGQTLDVLFASNLQNEMQENDDLAVWTVDQDLHTGAFPLASWSPADAVMYSARLKDFLGRQNFTRYASLTALQPLLNRVVKNSERLTVLIFCDGQGRLLGTPYDSGVNEIITNAAAKTKAVQPPFVLVLRSYQGEYLGCSVNRSTPLNFPNFPPPPKPEPPPAVKPAPVLAPAAVTPVPALIIVGTNAGTNLAAPTKLPPPPAPAPPSITNPPATNTPVPAAKMVAAPVTNPPPVSNPRAPVKPAPAPAPVAAAPAITTPTSPPAALHSNAAATTAEETASDTGTQWPMLLGGGLLAAAIALVAWLALRARRPRGSLITSSMQDDPRLPPRK